MAKKRWDVVATLRYTKRDGTEGKQYLRCGTAFEGDKGISMQLDAIPLRDWDGWLSLYEPKQKDAPKTSANGDDVPF